MKVTLLAFTLNEVDGMKAIMPQIKRDWVDQILIVDGGSTDGTIEWAEENGYEIFQQEERGAGAAFCESMERITNDVVITFSPDGNSIPEKIPELINKMKEGYDIVICSRYLGDAKSEDDDPITAFGNWMFTTLHNILFRGGITDCLVMYRAYRADLYQKLDLGTRSPAWGTQLLARAIKKGYKVTEIPGDEPARIGGVRKMHPLKNGSQELYMFFKEFFAR